MAEFREINPDVFESFRKEPNVTAVPCFQNAEMLIMTDVGEEAYSWYWHDLDGLGYEQIENHNGENPTAVFRKDGVIYTLSYTAFERTCRLIRDPDTALPPRTIAYPQVPVLVTQMRLLYACADCGMAYLIRLGDGRFAVIDSGMGEHEEPEHLLELMREQNVLDGKPVIAVWFFTHPHIDHYNTFVNLMERHRDEVVLESVAYNWPTRDMAKGFSDLTRFDAIMESLTETRKIIPRDGWSLLYPGVHFHVLYTCEDLYPAPFGNINDTSMVMQMLVENSVDYTVRRVLWMGDASGAASDYLVKKYSREVLECEIMQVGHHGYWGGSDALHRIVDAEVLLWPCPDFWYQVITKRDCNRYLVESEKVHTIYVAGQQEVVVNMDKSISPIDPYQDTGSTVLYQEDFSDTSVYHKAWSCVTGGRTGYRGMDIAIERSVCHLSAGEAWSVLEWVQPGRMTDSYTLTFRGKRTEDGGKIALFWNHPTPTEWADVAVLPLDLPETECTVTLTADAEAGKALLTVDGTMVQEMAYTPAEKHGLYLLMQNAALDVYEITVTR
ncbi:MAG: MBL fold metallo-hydrolase [Clostridia bacterium]|nr:MBL fold metallo-hydrolase [Clostridia bacterium]